MGTETTYKPLNTEAGASLSDDKPSEKPSIVGVVVPENPPAPITSKPKESNQPLAISAESSLTDNEGSPTPEISVKELQEVLEKLTQFQKELDNMLLDPLTEEVAEVKREQLYEVLSGLRGRNPQDVKLAIKISQLAEDLFAQLKILSGDESNLQTTSGQQEVLQPLEAGEEDGVEGIVQSPEELVELAEQLGVDPETINALDRIQDLSEYEVSAAGVSISQSPDEQSATLTTEDGREFKITAGAVLLAFVVLILSGDEVAGIITKELSDLVTREVLVKLGVPKNIIEEQLNKGDWVAEVVAALDTKTLHEKLTKKMSVSELYNFLEAMDKEQREKMMVGEAFDNRTSWTDQRKFTYEEIGQILHRLSDRQLKALGLTKAYQKIKQN